jgi:hypothetical protein
VPSSLAECARPCIAMGATMRGIAMLYPDQTSVIHNAAQVIHSVSNGHVQTGKQSQAGQTLIGCDELRTVC